MAYEASYFFNWCLFILLNKGGERMDGADRGSKKKLRVTYRVPPPNKKAEKHYTRPYCLTQNCNKSFNLVNIYELFTCNEIISTHIQN